MSLVKQLVTRLAHGEVSRLDELHQRHAGEECYLFGDGISLKWMDLTQFTDRVSMMGPMGLFHKEASALRIPYYALIEPFLFYPLTPVFGGGHFTVVRLDFSKEHRKLIAQNPQTTFFVNLSNYPVVRFSNALFVSRWYKPPVTTGNPFRDRVDAYRGTLTFQLSMAIYLGFKKAYLVGHDYTHFPSRGPHFYEKGRGAFGDHRGFCQGFIDYAKEHIDLVTVTLDGTSESMNYITYKDLTGKEPIFRENIDIVDRDKLASLARWSGYSIF